MDNVKVLNIPTDMELLMTGNFTDLHGKPNHAACISAQDAQYLFINFPNIKVHCIKFDSNEKIIAISLEQAVEFYGTREY